MWHSSQKYKGPKIHVEAQIQSSQSNPVQGTMWEGLTSQALCSIAVLVIKISE